MDHLLYDFNLCDLCILIMLCLWRIILSFYVSLYTRIYSKSRTKIVKRETIKIVFCHQL